ncbi:DUF6010 family protein [Nocardioides marmoribigeumensis]|jgi:hypothetical protein|uniref:DUF4260 family protein n=1 Tax=Nocardioides marmoribigeumensis TaxID=433649 RepID=A0ABU2BU18_9ACTN|nr:DUF6010 family protein [Nocardioides marmoribigeumensis]MDR7362120.1 hypothetical protein [Nocardioides marmoribigeumensis]
MTTASATVATGDATPRPRTRGALGRRWPTALAVTATATSLVLVSPLPAQVQTWISAWGVLTAAVIYLTWGTARGDLTARRWLTLETTGVLCFGALAIAATASDAATARYVLAAGWLAHAAWDAVHHRADRVVPRWYAELCMVCDLVVAASLVFIGSL